MAVADGTELLSWIVYIWPPCISIAGLQTEAWGMGQYGMVIPVTGD